MDQAFFPLPLGAAGFAAAAVYLDWVLIHGWGTSTCMWPGVVGFDFLDFLATSLRWGLVVVGWGVEPQFVQLACLRTVMGFSEPCLWWLLGVLPSPSAGPVLWAGTGRIIHGSLGTLVLVAMGICGGLLGGGQRS